jgi:hypothetical protein
VWETPALLAVGMATLKLRFVHFNDVYMVAAREVL